MKTVLILLALAGYALAQIRPANNNHCEIISNVSPTALRDFYTHFKYNNNDNNLKAYFKCIIERTDIFNDQDDSLENNFLDDSVEVPKQIHQDDSYVEMYGKICYTQVTRDHGDDLQQALDVFTCIYSGNGARKPVLVNDPLNTVNTNNY